MQAVAPSESAIGVMCAISRAGFAYNQIKSICASAAWQLVDDDPDLGYIRYEIVLAAGSSERRPVSIRIAESNESPFAFVPLFYFDEYDEGRELFDQAFRTLADQLKLFLGRPAQSGEYSYSHRSAWPYLFAGWMLPDATLMLVQDEFDIQFGMDVTLCGCSLPEVLSRLR